MSMNEKVIVQYWDREKNKAVTVTKDTPLPTTGGGSIPDGSIGTDQLADNAVTTEKLSSDAKAPFAGHADEAGAVDWQNVSNKPSQFPPDAHTHPIAQVDGLQDALSEYVKKSGDTMSGALKFGSETVDEPTDLSRHIDLYGGTYGISITSYTMNFLTATTSEATKYAFRHGDDVIGLIQVNISDPKSLTTKEYVDGVVPALLADVEPIADPSTATAEDIANAFNSLLAALKG